ncbi:MULTISPECIES: protein YgfX [unclassified Neisseria]|uniref:protein YgfX n=1 Tax=unclassified Neisseria TaxID=2623750 RepID=UPI0010719456|nr:MULTISPECIES: protein YgfX [unclassified Neisseria]MBF0803391.1 hypothetical protein [Neisseria sp. 19428wB4_WF04]TFU43901.1 hypothetical protein E4T99_03315 [Neisseria sp. WF04]
MRPFQTAFKPSPAGKALTVFLHLCAACLCFAEFYGAARIIGLLLLAAAFFRAWHSQNLRHADAVHKITVSPQGRAVVFTGRPPADFEAVLRPGSLVSPYAMFLKWDVGGRTIWQFVLPDMTERENFRRLLVWARWGQPKD